MPRQSEIRGTSVTHSTNTLENSPPEVSSRLPCNVFEVLPFLFVTGYIVACPYTKVEESFGMQATYDIMHQRNLTDFDHFGFPGVVPRSFIGPLSLSALSYPIAQIVGFTLGSPCENIHSLYIARLVLGWLHALFLVKVARSLRTLMSDVRTGNLFLLITCLQFHELYYASRTLPNSFAMIGFLAAFNCLLRSETLPEARAVEERLWALQILAFTCLVFRGELVMLIAPLVLSHLVTGRIPFLFSLYTGITTGVISILISVVIDSAFWGRLLWPEGEVLYFNVVLNKSHEWGVLPFHWYFSTGLPKSMLIFSVLAPFAIISVKRLRVYTLPAVLFVVLFSCLPHKELRFVFYSIPIFNVAVAVLIGSIAARMNRTLFWTAILFISAACLSVCGVLTYVSSRNYPGGDALAELHGMRGKGGSVHIGTGPSMEGITRFQKNRCGKWSYSKDPNPPPSQHPFDYIITEECDDYSKKGYRIMSNVTAYGGIDTDRVKAFDLWPFPAKERVAVYLMEVSSTTASRVQRIMQGSDMGP